LIGCLLIASLLVQPIYVDLYHKGDKLLKGGDLKGAEIALKEASSANYVPALKSLGEVYVKLKQLPDAVKQYQKAVELNPRDISAREHLAELYSWVGDYDKSIVTYRDSLALDPGNLSMKTGLAKVLRWSHRYDEAEKLYLEALDEDQAHHESLKGLAKTYAMMGELNGAIDTLDKAIKFYPDDAELHKEKGTVLAWRKDFKKAIISIEEAVKLSPKYTDAYRTMGEVYLWMKAYNKAVESFKKLIGIEPNNIQNHLHLAAAYRTMGNLTMAEESVKGALKIDPSNTKALDLLQAVRGDEKYLFNKRLGDVIELTSFLFVFVLIMISHNSKKRMLRRRHKLYFVFINIVLPLLLLATFVSFLSKNALSQWIDTGLLEDVTEATVFFALGTSLLAFLLTERRSHDLNNMVILAVGAHPDDMELGCGAFIMKAKDNGAKVYGLTLTKGEKGTDANRKREKELAKGAEFMEMDGFWVYDFKDTELKGYIPQIKDVIEEKIKDIGASIVLTHTAIDIHTDHQAVFEATNVAARKDISILCYEDVSTPREFVPNYFVDVSGYIDDKMRLIAIHKSQSEKAYMDPEVIKGRAAHRGLQSGVQFAEAYRAHKLLTW